MPFIPTIFWYYINFDLNLLSIATEDKSTDKPPEHARFDETNSSFSELLNERAKKERKEERRRRRKQIKNNFLGCDQF
jgi:hypothetical protein